MTQNNCNYNMQGLSSISNHVNSSSHANLGPNKKAKMSFMEYYHSVPNKSPSNILEKYMKRKKWLSNECWLMDDFLTLFCLGNGMKIE